MYNRDFSDTIKLEIIKNNLEKNKGEINCEVCNKKIVSINDCHFDHILPYSKGGKTTISNCQILCVNCNLKKNDKDLKEFLLEEKARKFLSGEIINDLKEDLNIKSLSMSKEIFDKRITEFINKKGDISKVDFGREYNNLPSIYYVKKYYGDLNNLKKVFGIEDLSLNWNRESIKLALDDYIIKKGNIFQKDLKKKNKIPSLPCILKYYPEYKNFIEIKKELCNIKVLEKWTVENTIAFGKTFLEHNEKITQKDLCASNHLPTVKVINKLFGSLENYQKVVGSEISKKNELISKAKIDEAVNFYFEGKERIIESRKNFFECFPYSLSTIEKRYNSFNEFCDIYEIKIINTRKSKYTKREVDDAISNWVKLGNKIPTSKDFTKLGLPSISVILKFYEDWKEPFYLYEKIYEEINRN